MKKIGCLFLLWPIWVGSQDLLVWDLCRKNQCFWVENASKMDLKLSFSPDCKLLMESSSYEFKLYTKRIFHFNSKALYQWMSQTIAPVKIKALTLKFDDEEHCLPIHCHPSEENCDFEGAYVVDLTSKDMLYQSFL